jgi:hypothetical protein
MLQETERESGYCFPLALDSTMRNAELPNEFYRLFFDDYNSSNPSYNHCVSILLSEFFGVNPEPETDIAAIAKFNAFGSSPQKYMPDITDEPYRERMPRMLERGITEKQLRLQELLAAASLRGCNVLFTNFHSEGEHVSGLELIDPGESKNDAAYVIRDWVKIKTGRVYSSGDLAGINQIFGGKVDEYTPLPERARTYFPDNEASWELVILPPEPIS